MAIEEPRKHMMHTVNNSGGPTPAEKIRKLMSTDVELPELSKRANEPVRVSIRVISNDELFEAMEGIPIPALVEQYREKFLEGLSPEEVANITKLSIEADKKIIMKSVFSPRVLPDETEELPPNAIAISALMKDRFFLVRTILDFSGLQSEPPRVPPAPASEGAEVPEGSFRGAAGDPDRHGEPVEPAAQRDPEPGSGQLPDRSLGASAAEHGGGA